MFLHDAVAENASKDTDEIIEAIQGFIEASSVGQFPSRLRMIHTFYVQLVNSQDTSAGNGNEIGKLTAAFFLTPCATGVFTSYSWKTCGNVNF